MDNMVNRLIKSFAGVQGAVFQKSPLAAGGKKKELQEKAAGVKLLLTDCDGVLTDSGVYYSPNGEELKRFSIRDGMGAERIRDLVDVDIGIISGDDSVPLRKRAEKLGIQELHVGIKDKLSVVEEIMNRRNFSAREIAYIGDDVNDLEVLSMVGFSACPADALPQVKEQVDYICRLKGGEGAFREFCELIILGGSAPTQNMGGS
jgi:3-deoxy-D-manno-octulosonate 8-phosphate phosphatase (KDO 8-P phosphatase)